MSQVKRILGGGALLVALLSPTAAAGFAAGPGPGHFTSDNVAWISVNPLHTGSSGGRLHEGYFYVTDPRGVYIYDVANPAAPALKGFVNVLQGGTSTSNATFAALGQEDPDTNGEILLVNAVNPAAPAANELLIIDVSVKTAPRVLSKLATVDHTWTCVADCTYAYGRTGGILDLTTPASPKIVGNWRTITGIGSAPYTHDFTEIAPGRLMSAGSPSFYLDVTDPTQPKELTRLRKTFHTLGYHSAEWPRGGQDAFMVMGTELAPAGTTTNGGSNCKGNSPTDGEIATYDTSAVLAAEQEELENPDGVWGPAEFTKIAKWEISGSGTYNDGNAPFHVLYCAHWFDPHPKWNNGGLLAVAHYEWGTRFLKVDPAGTISQVGWFQPVGGSTASAYWITDDIVYSMDYRRGMDILRFTA